MQNIKHLYAKLVSANQNWSSAVKSRAKLAGLILRIIPLVYGTLSVSTVKISFGYAQNVVKLYRAQGSKGTAKYLKACYVLLQQSAGGFRIPAPWDLGCNVARTRKGVPRMINPQQRLLVIKGDVPTIRFWLSLLGLYRVIEFKGALKLKTIYAPGVVIPQRFVDEWRGWVPEFLKIAERAAQMSWKLVPSKDLTPWSIPVIRKSSPNSGGLASVAAIPLDLVRWAFEPRYLGLLLRWLKVVDGIELVWALRPFVKRIEEWLREEKGSKVTPVHFLGSVRTGLPITSKLFQTWWPVTALGKLGFKEEPGKIRVFAMVDVLTQAIMLPLHKALFKRLRPLCTDGTFDQIAPVERLIKRMNETGKTFVASYDLSAATDRLPISLQEDILKEVMGTELAQLWVHLLVGRSYALPRIARSYNVGMTSVRYAVGQPMGAYSSWAMLAVTHHAIVQLAAMRVYRVRGWFEWYAVLGDDIVIADEAVAQEYLKIMAVIGVEIGLAKSLVSRTKSLEFAKRTYINGTDCSPVSLAEALVALRHIGSLEELVRKQLRYGVVKLSSVARFAGFGYKVLSKLSLGFVLANRCGRMSAYLHRPGGVWAMPLKDWLTAVGPGMMGREVTTWWNAGFALWKRILQALIGRVTRFEAHLPFSALYNYHHGEYRPLKKGETQPHGEASKKGFVRVQSYLKDGGSLTRCISVQAFNDFFREWVTYPHTQALRKVFSSINDKLRVLSPFVMPAWESVEELWTSVMLDESEASLLPSRITYLIREDEVRPSDARILDLWKALRKTAKLGQPGLGMVEGFVDPPHAERRWTRGLGQDRLFMDTSIVWNEFAEQFSKEKARESQTRK
jgi:hypothetical protein